MVDYAIRYTFTASGASTVVAQFNSIAEAARKAGVSVRGASTQSAQAVQTSTNRIVRSHKTGATATRRLTESDDYYIRTLGRLQRQREQLTSRMDRFRQRNVESARREARAVEAAQKRQQAAMKRTANYAAGVAARGVLRLGGMAGGAILGFAGAGVREGIRLEDMARRISIKGSGGRIDEKTGEVIPGTYMDPTKLRQMMQRAAVAAPGMTGMDIATGMSAFVKKTGDLPTAVENMQMLADMSIATGTSMKDLGFTMSEMTRHFGITTKRDLAEAFANLAVQGKRGAFELEDVAKEFQKLAPAAKAFGMGIGGGVEGINKLGAWAQIARLGTKSGPMAGTALENVMRELQSKATRVQRLTGVEVYQDVGGLQQTRDFSKVITDIIVKAEGNMEKLNQVFGRRSARALSHLVGVYLKAATGAETAAERESKGRRKIEFEIDKFADTTGALRQMEQDRIAAEKMTSASITGAWEKFVMMTSEELTPTIVSLIKQFSKFVDSGVVEGMLKNLSTLATAIGSTAELLGFKPKEKSKEEQLQEALLVRERLGRFDPRMLSSDERKKLLAANMKIGKLTDEIEAEGVEAGRVKTRAAFGSEFGKAPIGSLLARSGMIHPQLGSMIGIEGGGGWKPGDVEKLFERAAFDPEKMRMRVERGEFTSEQAAAVNQLLESIKYVQGGTGVWGATIRSAKEQGLDPKAIAELTAAALAAAAELNKVKAPSYPIYGPVNPDALPSDY